MSKDYTIKIDQGADWYLNVEYTDAAGVGIPLLGYTAKMQLREYVASPTAAMTLESKTANITNVTASGGTITYTASNSFAANQKVSIYNVIPSAYNLLDKTIASANSTSFTITNAATGSYVSGGTAMASSGITFGENEAGALSMLTLRATAAQTTLLTAREYFYDLKIVSPSGVVTRLLQGVAVVDDQVTRD